jgi:hypothetical protein
MALINWKTGGALGGVMAGAAIAGPVGAILGGGLGLLFGSQVEHDKQAAQALPPNVTHQLPQGQQPPAQLPKP